MSFLDEAVFPVANPRAKELLKLLAQAYDSPPKVEVIAVTAGIDKNAILWNQPVNDLWRDVLKAAAAGDQLRLLVTTVVQDPTTTAFRIPIESLLASDTLSLASGPSNTDHCRTTLIGRRPVVDRKQLRDHLANLVAGNGDQVLLVDGPPASGRSYSWHLIAHVGKATATFQSYLIDLASWSDGPARPSEIAEMIAVALDWPAPKYDQTAQEETLARTLLFWLKGKATTEERTVCLVFDGLDRPEVTQSAARFVGQIAAAAGNGELGSFRVVLLAFAGSLGPGLDGWVMRDEVGPIPLDEVRDFFASVSAQGGLLLSEAQMDGLLAKLLGSPLPKLIPPMYFDRRAADLALALSRGAYV